MLESPDIVLGEPVEIQLYLASSSPRRKELLSLLSWEYNQLPVQVDETPLSGEEGAFYVKRISSCKVLSAINRAGVPGVIIAADTAVIDFDVNGGERILGKPPTSAEAAEMLRNLRGHTHQVITAVSLLNTESGTMLGDSCTTDVPMRSYRDDEIDDYVATGDPLDKAGAYAIQNASFHPVESLKGCYANVMGLPLCHLARSLLRLGIQPGVDVPQVCQAALKYNCPVYRGILSATDRDVQLI